MNCLVEQMKLKQRSGYHHEGQENIARFEKRNTILENQLTRMMSINKDLEVPFGYIPPRDIEFFDKELLKYVIWHRTWM